MNVILILSGVGYFANPSLIFWSQISGFADSSGEVTLPESWFVSGTPASQRKLASVILYRGAGQVNLQFGGTSTTEAGPELLPAVEAGIIITFRQGTNSLILSGISDQTEPYSWVPSNSGQVKTFASQVASAGGADCSIELHYVVAVVTLPPQLSLSSGIRVGVRTSAKLEAAPPTSTPTPTPTPTPTLLSLSSGLRIDVRTNAELKVVTSTSIPTPTPTPTLLSLSSGTRVSVRTSAKLKVFTPPPTIFWAVEASSADSVQVGNFSDPFPVQLGLPGGKGDKGIAGQRGPQGLKGNLGEKGLKGVVGQTGDQGLRGGRGPRGLIGIAGQPGDQGTKGSVGPRGLIGIVGQQGSQGPRGGVGARGGKGLKGSRGQGGVSGSRGDRGPLGDAGIKGAKGVMGRDGVSGDKGGTGVEGERGDMGAADPSSIGPMGLKGAVGPPGTTIFNQQEYNRGYVVGWRQGADDCGEDQN